MKNAIKLFTAMLLGGALAQAQPALTTVKDTWYNADGSLASGTVQIDYESFGTSDPKPVFGGYKRITLTSGALNVALAPNSGTSPSGTSYRVRLYQDLTNYKEEYWVVPTSSPVATPAAPTSVTQSGTPGSTTYCYFVSAINANGETLLGTATCTTTSNATLSGSNYNIIATPAVTGSTACRVWRATSSTAPTAGATGLYAVSGTVSCGSNKNDQSNTLTSATVPATNTTDPKTLAQVRAVRPPSISMVFAASQVSGTAVVETPSATQTITAPSSTGTPLEVKGKSGNSDNVFAVYDNAGTPAITLAVEAAGDVGIGTSNPASALQVSRTGANSRVRVDTTTSGSPMLGLTTVGQTDWTIGVDRTASGKLIFSNDTAFTAPRMTITAAGDIVDFPVAGPLTLRAPRATSGGAGADLEIIARGAQSGATDQNGGDLHITPGTATGAGTGATILRGVIPGVSGSTDRTPVDTVVVASGGVHIGNAVSGAPTTPLDVEQTTALGGTAGNSVEIGSFMANAGSNSSSLRVRQYRSSTASTHESAEFRLQRLIDTTYMGYIGFTGSTGYPYRSITLGYGNTPWLTLDGSTGEGTPNASNQDWGSTSKRWDLFGAALDLSGNATLASGTALTWGGDTTLYRAAADVLRTDDRFDINGGTTYLLFPNKTASTTAIMASTVSGDTNNRLEVYAGGKFLWGSGSAGPDVTTSRTGSNQWRVNTNSTDQFSVDSGYSDALTGLKIGTGAEITKHLSATASLDFDFSGAGITCDDKTITVTGAAAGDTVDLGVPNAAWTTGVQFTAWVSAADTVTVRGCDVTSGNDNPSAATVRVGVWQH